MDKSFLVRLLGFSATLNHGDTLVLDRWRWLKHRLPITRNAEKLIDVGCGSGAFSIGAALRGYYVWGLSWDERNQAVAIQRANMCRAHSAQFEVQDVRVLNERRDLFGMFDFAVCFECIEHIIDDRRLLRSIAVCLKPGGRLLLTTPNLHYRPITTEDMGPFSKVEDGWHVRRGYTEAMLDELCIQSGLILEQVSFCSGFVSQKVTYVLRKLTRLHPLIGWAFVLPLRMLPPVLDWLITPLLRWPYFSICIEAYKPRFSGSESQQITQS